MNRGNALLQDRVIALPRTSEGVRDKLTKQDGQDQQDHQTDLQVAPPINFILVILPILFSFPVPHSLPHSLTPSVTTAGV